MVGGSEKNRWTQCFRQYTLFGVSAENGSEPVLSSVFHKTGFSQTRVKVPLSLSVHTELSKRNATLMQFYLYEMICSDTGYYHQPFSSQPP